MDPGKYNFFPKFVQTKTTEDAQSKLIVRDLTQSWELVRVIL